MPPGTLVAELARFFAPLTAGAVSQWKRNGIPDGRLQDFARRVGCSYDWLISGIEAPEKSKITEAGPETKYSRAPTGDFELESVVSRIAAIRETGLDAEWRFIRNAVDMASRALPPDPDEVLGIKPSRERRLRSPRYKLRLPVTLDPGGLAVIRDLGLAGACAEHRDEVKPGREIQVFVDLPRGKVRASAVVVWTKPGRVGSVKSQGVGGFRSGILFRNGSR